MFLCLRPLVHQEAIFIFKKKISKNLFSYLLPLTFVVAEVETDI